LSKSQLYAMAGTIWGLVGLFLIYRGMGLYELAVQTQQATQQGIIISLIAGLIIGGAKGKFVLSKTAKRNKLRIEKLEGPLKFHHVYAKSFYLFIGAMMLLGFLLRQGNEYLGGYLVVAAIYCGIGTALLVSSLTYWKSEPVLEESS